MDNNSLKSGLHFDSTDLLANRAGKLSEWQAQRLREKRKGSLRRTAISVALLVALIGFASLVGISWFANLVENMTQHPINGVVAAKFYPFLVVLVSTLPVLIPSVVIAFLWTNIRQWRFYTYDLEKPIRHVDGQIEMSGVADGSVSALQRTESIIRVSGHEFHCSPLAKGAVDPDRYYRVYFTLYSNMLLSVDTLASPPKVRHWD